MPFVRQSLSRTDTELDRCLTRIVLVISIAAITLAIAAASAGAHSASQSDAVIAWNANAGDAALAACIAPTDNPLHESRLYAMTHVAIHDALNAIESRAEPYAFDGRARKGASAEAAVAAAARDVLVSLLPQIPFPLECTSAGVASVEADYAVALSAIPNGRAKTRGLEVGREAAEAILALRDGDGSNTQLQDFDYRQGTEPGVYRFTPGFEFAFAPGWRDVTPFVLDDSSQFRPGPPYRVTGRRYAADLNEVKRLGGDGVTTPSARTAEETEIARFWVESSPLQWNRITRAVSSSQRLDRWQQARLFGLLNLSMADGYVASFDTKYHYNYWRPVTAIQNADADGNRRTSGDSDWTPLLPTPPIPDYDSAHAVEGGTASQVLKRFFGTDHIGFETCSLSLPEDTCNDATPRLRRYTSFSQAAAENGLSRILVGFHFRKAVDEGIAHGNKIGNLAVDRFLRPERRHGNHHGHKENGRIAFDSDRAGGDPDIWTMNPDGSGLVNLTADSGGADERASWRADGRKIAFMSDRRSPAIPPLPASPVPTTRSSS